MTFTIDEAKMYCGAPIPKGWDLVGFRLPLQDESYQSTITHDWVENVDSYAWKYHWGPRRILRKIPKRIVFTPTGEVRAPKKGEWYVFVKNCITLAEGVEYTNAYPILIRTEE